MVFFDPAGEKTKDLEPLPSFNFGLTQLEEEQRNVTVSSSGGDKNKERKTREAKGKEKNVTICNPIFFKQAWKYLC